MSPPLRCDACGFEAPRAPGARCPTDGRVLVNPGAREKHPEDTLLGRLLAEQIAVYDVLTDAGGYATVYLGIQAPMDREVVVKVVRAETLARPGMKARFLHEARVLSRIRDPRVVILHQFLETDDGLLCMVLERLKGHPLSTILTAKSSLPLARAAALLDQVLEGLETAHGHGIVHRDLKPSNLIVGPDGQVTLIDFGIAKQVHGGAEDAATPQTQAGQILGTPAYMAPEQLKDARPVDHRADIYAAGVMLYRMLAGRLPFEGSVSEVMAAHIYEPTPELPPELGLPSAVDAVIRCAMAKRPDDRFAAAAEMRAAIADYAGPQQPMALVTPASSALQRTLGHEETMGSPVAGALMSSPPAPTHKTPAPTGPNWTRLAALGIVLVGLGGLMWPADDPVPAAGTVSVADASAARTSTTAVAPRVTKRRDAAPPPSQNVVDAARPSPDLAPSLPDAAPDRPDSGASTATKAAPTASARADKRPRRPPVPPVEPRPSTPKAKTPETPTPVVVPEPAAPTPDPAIQRANAATAQALEDALRKCRCTQARKVLAKFVNAPDLRSRWEAKVKQCEPRLPGRPCRYVP